MHFLLNQFFHPETAARANSSPTWPMTPLRITNPPSFAVQAPTLPGIRLGAPVPASSALEILPIVVRCSRASRLTLLIQPAGCGTAMLPVSTLGYSRNLSFDPL